MIQAEPIIEGRLYDGMPQSVEVGPLEMDQDLQNDTNELLEAEQLTVILKLLHVTLQRDEEYVLHHSFMKERCCWVSAIDEGQFEGYFSGIQVGGHHPETHDSSFGCWVSSVSMCAQLKQSILFDAEWIDRIHHWGGGQPPTWYHTGGSEILLREGSMRGRWSKYPYNFSCHCQAHLLDHIATPS